MNKMAGNNEEDDFDGYVSEEDDDYVPEDGTKMKDEEGGGEEDLEDEEEDGDVSDGEVKACLKEKGEMVPLQRKRRKVEESDKSAHDESGNGSLGLAQETEAEKKARLDALFLAEFGPTSSSTSKSVPLPSSASITTPKATTANPLLAKKPSVPSTVSITKVFDFAGESVTVTKEVSKDSKEAKRFEREANSQPSVLSNLVGKIKGKQSLTTLKKSEMDWNKFVAKEGIAEDLKRENKDGYLERVSFLQRIDQQQHEREIEAREKLRNMNRP